MMRDWHYRGGDGLAIPVIQADGLAGRFHHGFTTRAGGVSAPPFDSFNLGGRWGDDAAAVAENRRRLRQVAGLGAARPGEEDIHFANQVHGAAVARVGPGQTYADTAARHADAVLAELPGAAVGVFMADCVPILVGNVATGACAAVHAGWRGTVAGVLPAALSALLGMPGARAGDLRVAIGPSIGPCCFEVGPEVVAAVEARFPTARAEGAVLERSEWRRPHVDLWRLNALAARGAGVDVLAIEVAETCTSCGAERFYSFRRDHGRTGLLAAFIRAR